MISYKKLASGARLVVEEIPYLRSCAIGIFVKVGSRDEADDESGLSHLIEHMLFKGTEKRTARDIAETFEEMGGQLNAYTAKEYTCYYARCLDENLPLALDVLFDMVLNSSFGQRELDTERGVIIEEINMYEDTPDDLIHDVFARVVWDGQALGRPILGTQDIIANISRQRIIDYYHKYYRPSNMVIAVAGNVEQPVVEDFVYSYIGQATSNCDQRIIERPRISRGKRLLAKDTEQVYICIGQEGVSYHDPRRYAQNVMNNILGGGLSSRLFQSIREERGLAYSVYSYPTLFSDTGSFAIYAGVGAQRLEEFFSALKDEINLFVDKGVTPEEVTRTQTMIKTNTLLGLESVMNRMTRLGKSVLYYDQVIDTEEVLAEIMKVTPDMVREYATTVLDPSNFSLAAIAPEKTLAQVSNIFASDWGWNDLG